eukprot:TRINITY_DN2198_c0_g2_i6.p1 TRINITY_DN2198_c0_g2~~TRINITY_DN2198_c0_g2_i6.p1  ORF type:complete len:435 (-),score=113.07 TRINITY_DN2198_c0_g2_i6:14-1318(-)
MICRSSCMIQGHQRCCQVFHGNDGNDEMEGRMNVVEVHGRSVKEVGKDDLPEQLYDPRPPKMLPPDSILAPFNVLPSFGWTLVKWLPQEGVASEESLQVVMFMFLVFFFTTAVYDSIRAKKPIRFGRGYLVLVSGSMAGGGTLLITINVLASETKGSGVFFIYLVYVAMMALIVLGFWKISKLATDSYNCLPFLFPFQCLDDVFGDTIFLENQAQGFTVWSVLIILALIVRLILRDIGYFEMGLNWIRDMIVGDPSKKYVDVMSPREQERHALFVRAQNARKYWLYAAQDLLSEHLSVLIIPTMLIFDKVLGGDCLFTCGWTDDQLVSMVISFAVLLIVKVGCNELVERLTYRKMARLDDDINMFVAKHGELDRWDPLVLWAEFDDGELLKKGLVEQCKIVKQRHVQRHLVYFLFAVFLTCAFAISIAGQVALI